MLPTGCIAKVTFHACARVVSAHLAAVLPDAITPRTHQQNHRSPHDSSLWAFDQRKERRREGAALLARRRGRDGTPPLSFLRYPMPPQNPLEASGLRAAGCSRRLRRLRVLRHTANCIMTILISIVSIHKRRSRRLAWRPQPLALVRSAGPSCRHQPPSSRCHPFHGAGRAGPCTLPAPRADRRLHH